MVQTEILQFTSECNTWKKNLHSHRDKLHNMQTTLQQAVNRPLSKDEQTELERFQNQLYIQLINVHDLKHALKMHDHKLNFDIAGNTQSFFAGNESAYHENLYNNYQLLENILSDLRTKLSYFLKAIISYK